MDIFTTQLTRVVPVPIKPASLKVKALLKDAGASKLKEDPDHLENHEYYFSKDQAETESEAKQQRHSQDNSQSKKDAAESIINECSNEKAAKQTNDETNKVKHLDLYV